MKHRSVVLLASALLSASCSKKSGDTTIAGRNSSTATANQVGGDLSSRLDAYIADTDAQIANMQGGVANLASQSFFDPAWGRSLGDSPMQNDVDEIRRVIFMAKGNPKLQANENFKFFIAALYDCSEAHKAGSSEFDKERILNAAMQRLNTYLASQPNTLTYDDKNTELGQWNSTTQTFTWSDFNNSTLTPIGPRTDPVIPCGRGRPLVASTQERSYIDYEYANRRAIEAAVQPIRMDEQAGRQFVATHPERKIVVRYTWVSRPETPGYTYVSMSDKIFRPVVSKVEIIDPNSGAILSTTSL